MKKNIPIHLSSLFVLFTLFLIGIIVLSGCIDQPQNVIKISGANAIQPIMEVWAIEYQKLHPDITINVEGGGAGKGITDALAGVTNIGMVSRDIRQDEIAKGAFYISVCSDAVVATMNTQNPVKDLLLTRGVTKQQFEELFTNTYNTRTIKTWGDLVNNVTLSTDRIWVYTRQDSCGAAEMWALYLGNYLQDNLTAVADTAIIEDPKLRSVIQENIYGIGYNNINTIYDVVTKEPYPGILPIPIDLNENGVIDENESFYENSSQIMEAIRNHLYPWPPARNLHLVTKQNFTGITKDFVYWILTDGQQYVPLSGYIQLPQETLSLQLHYLEQGTRP